MHLSTTNSKGTSGMPIVITLDGTDDPEEVRAIGRLLMGYKRRDAPNAMLYCSPAPQADVAWGVADQNTLAALQKMRVQPVPSPLDAFAYANSASDGDPTAAQPTDSEIDAAVAAAARNAGLIDDAETDGATGDFDVVLPAGMEHNEFGAVIASELGAAAVLAASVPPPPAPAVVPPPPVELDAKGEPWNPEIHASSKTKVKDGTWRMKRGAGNVEGPLSTDGVPPPPNAAKAMIERLTQYLTVNPYEASKVLAAVQEVGLTKGFPELVERPDLIPALIEELGWDA